MSGIKGKHLCYSIVLYSTSSFRPLFQARGKSTDAGHLAPKAQQVRDKTPTIAKNSIKQKDGQKTAVKSVPSAQKGQNKGGKPAAAPVPQKTPPQKPPPQITPAPPKPAPLKNPKKKHSPQDLVVTINLVSKLLIVINIM